ncbi:hypothetical protein SAMD00019534_008810 [Acytostelium subglobosum LB1]|uniref:hypothetical protein n=1 Tax=Acytostelium subglobosum LB1 TaxID=1410327 RepID=UPI000644CBDE|nr:hypothetical protein SAMD00019534_008810 [Acytostelium subglobosum LB1]GAM17706.1 hypothetical protein SAMD00019534_008810 [Acytostelium subglobosum LB1]|eukprot:XP_012758302.1 hypothetical protein SAMD00019534_008810 [Acytostelium subglobosum LB1]
MLPDDDDDVSNTTKKRQQSIQIPDDLSIPFDLLSPKQKLYNLGRLTSVNEVLMFYETHKGKAYSSFSASAKYYNLVMTSLKRMGVEHQVMDRVFKNYQMVQQPKDSPEDSQFVYNTYMSYYCDLGEVGKVEKIFKTIPNPDVHSYTILITTYVNASMIDQAISTLAQLSKVHTPSSASYQSLLVKLAEDGDFSQCYRILKQMVQDGIELDRSFYASLLPRVAKDPSGQAVDLLYSQMINTKSVFIDDRLFRRMVEALVKSGNTDRSAQVIQLYDSLLPRSEKYLTSVTFYYILRCCPLDRAEQLWRKHIGDQGSAHYMTKFNVRLYAKILGMLPDPGTQKITQLFRLAQSRFDEFNNIPFFFNLILHAHLKENNIGQAWIMYQLLERQKIINTETYHAMIIYCGFHQNYLGDRLADFVDAGGGVVLGTYSHCGGGNRLEGRWMKENYDPLNGGVTSRTFQLKLGQISLENHPVLHEVNSFCGGSQSSHGDGTLAKDSVLIASWENGRPLIAELPTKKGKIISLNFYPPSSNSVTDSWPSNSDGGRLLSNSLKYVKNANY